MPKHHRTVGHPSGSCWHCAQMAMEHTRQGPVLVRDMTPEEIEEKLTRKAEELAAEETQALRQRLLIMASRPEDWLITCPRCSDPLMLQEDGTEACVCGWRTGESWIIEEPREKSWQRRLVVTSVCTIAAMVTCLALGFNGATGWGVGTLIFMSLLANFVSMAVQYASDSAERELQQEAKLLEQRQRKLIEDARTITAKVVEANHAVQRTEQALLTAIGRTGVYPPPGFEGMPTTPKVAEKLYMNGMISKQTYRDILDNEVVGVMGIPPHILDDPQGRTLRAR